MADNQGSGGGSVPSQVNLGQLPVTPPPTPGASLPIRAIPIGYVSVPYGTALPKIPFPQPTPTEGSGRGGGASGGTFDTNTFSRASLSRYTLHSAYDLFGPILQSPIASVIQQAPYKAGQLAKAIYLGVSTLPGVRSEL